MLRTRFREITICILLICIWQSVNSQSVYKSEYYFAEKFNIDDGLSQLNINALLKDKDGFIWIGTDDGLNRFDGYGFEVFRHIAGDSSSISNNKIYSLFEDSKGRLWVGTNLGGLQLYDRKTGRFKTYMHDPNDKYSISNNAVNYIHEGSDGYLWVGTNQGLNRFDPETEIFTRIYKGNGKSGLVGNEIRSIQEKQEGEIWVGTQDGLSLMDTKFFNTRNYTHDNADAKSLIHNSVTALFNDSKGNLWIGTEGGGVCRYDAKNDSFQQKFEDSQANIPITNIVYSITEDDFGNIWFSSMSSGLFVFESDKARFSKVIFPHDQEIHSTIVAKLLNTGDGNIWVGTWEKGLQVLTHRKKAFRHVEYLNTEMSKIGRNSVRTIFEDSENNIWFATSGAGLFKYIPPTGSYIHFLHDSEDESTLSGNIVKPIIESNDGFIYAGTYVNGLNKINRKTHEIARINHDPNDPHSLRNDNIWALCFDSQERIWVGTLGGGMDEYIPGENKFIHHYTDPDDTLSISTDRISKIFEDSNGNLWIGTIGGGICRMDREKRIFHRYQYTVTAEAGVGFNEVIDIFEDRNNRLWISSNGGGLFFYNRSTDKFEKAEANHKLKASILSILDDDKGNLWMGTFEGIVKYNPNTGAVKNYNQYDGLQSNDFKSGSKLISSTGEFYFGGSNGYNVFRPEEIIDDTTTKPVVFTNLYLFHEKVSINDSSGVLMGDINYQNSLVLDANQNTISFEYSSLDYTFPKFNNYAYMLEGFDQKWREVGTERKATYTNLPPGEYTFQVKSSNSDGNWSNELKTIEVIITPPFWDTVWFRISAVVVIFLIIFSIFKLRIRAIQQQNLKLEKLVNERTIGLEKANKALLKEQQKVSLQNEELITQQEQLKSAQARLVHSEKMASLGILAAGVGHEINNPLNYIKIGLENIKIELDTVLQKKSGVVQSCVEVIEQGVSRVTTIVKSLSHFSRVGEDNSEECSISKIIENCLEILSNKSKDVSIIKKYEDQNITILGNEGKLHQAFLNIISNALQALDDNGKIEISIFIENNYVVTSVKDNGTGIKKEDLSRIGDPFFTTKPPGEGTGLGLFITFSIVEDHKGKIEVISEPGEGAEFILKLPLTN